MRISAETNLISTAHVIIIRAVASIRRSIPVYLAPIIIVALNEASRFRLFDSEILSFLCRIFNRLADAFRAALFNLFLKSFAVDRSCVNIFKR